jgi:hypothetical protein
MLRVRLTAGGKKIDPVLENGKGTIVFIGGDNEEEALAVGTDIVSDQAQTIDANRWAEGEEPDGVADLDTVSLLVNVDGHHFVTHGNEIQLLAITGPTGPASAIGGSLPQTISGREGNDKNLRSPVRQHSEGNEPAVGRELSARLSAGVRAGQQAPFFLGIQRNNADFGISARQIGAFGKQITAIRRPVRGAIGRGEFLKGNRFPCTRRGTSNDAE